MSKLNNVSAPEALRTLNKVEIELGGKTYPIRYPVSAFVKFQEKYKGWRTAWKKMAETYDSDVDYDVLTDFLVIGINLPEMTSDVVKTLLMDSYQDEIAEILVAIAQASKKWLPEEVKKEGANPTK